jgi:spore coat protein U-like protein
VAFGCVLDVHAAMVCSIAVTPAPFTGIYSSTANLNVLGRLDLTCTRDPVNDARRPNIWIGIASGGAMTLDTGGSTLSYSISRKGFGSGPWTNSGSQNPNQTGTGGLADTIDFGQSGATYTGSYDVYFQVPLGQVSAAAGVYLDPAVAVTMRLTDQAGAVLATTTLGARVSIPKSCRFSTDPTPISVIYPAFSASPVLGQSTFALTCTQGTSYSLALDRTRSLIPTIELAYDLTLSAATSTGNAVAQPFTVDISVDAGQAGRCSGSTCNGTDTRTITITY